MLATDTAEEHEIIAPAMEEAFRRRPTKKQVLDAMVAEGINRSEAGQLLAFLKKAVQSIRIQRIPCGVVGEMLRSIHKQMLIIMPDDSIAGPGTAYDMIQQYLLDPEKGEMRLVHTSLYDPETGLRSCVVDMTFDIEHI